MDTVRRYYDRNTRLFLWADTTRSGTIHRRLWPPGIEDSRQAAEVVHERIAPHVSEGARVLDLGCGVGATAAYLSRTRRAKVTGVTLSPVQAAIARQRVQALGCEFLERDFLSLEGLGSFEVAVAIESFSHAADARRFFASVAGALRPSGSLLVCDDFVADTAKGPEAHRRLERIRRGWHFQSFDTVARATEAARGSGFELVHAEDFTPHLRTHPDWVLTLLRGSERVLRRLPGVGRSAFVDNWQGGTALQECQRRGESTYGLLVFRR
jgi:cyclopropane fatty-acyl-phospholipid synthase-like methyltransferase